MGGQAAQERLVLVERVGVGEVGQGVGVLEDVERGAGGRQVAELPRGAEMGVLDAELVLPVGVHTLPVGLTEVLGADIEPQFAVAVRPDGEGGCDERVVAGGVEPAPDSHVGAEVAGPLLGVPGTGAEGIGVGLVVGHVGRPGWAGALHDLVVARGLLGRVEMGVAVETVGGLGDDAIAGTRQDRRRGRVGVEAPDDPRDAGAFERLVVVVAPAGPVGAVEAEDLAADHGVASMRARMRAMAAA